jgi:hypothetical protein
MEERTNDKGNSSRVKLKAGPQTACSNCAVNLDNNIKLLLLWKVPSGWVFWHAHEGAA